MYQADKGNINPKEIFSGKTQHWNSPRILWRAPNSHTTDGEGKWGQGKLKETNCKTKIQRTNLEARAKQKIRTEQVSTAAAKITYKEDKRKGDTGGNKSGEKREERRINPLSSWSFVFHSISLEESATPLQMIRQKRGRRAKSQPKSGAVNERNREVVENKEK